MHFAKAVTALIVRVVQAILKAITLVVDVCCGKQSVLLKNQIPGLRATVVITSMVQGQLCWFHLDCDCA